MKTNWVRAACAVLLVVGGTGSAAAQDKPPAPDQAKEAAGDPPAAGQDAKPDFEKAKGHYVAATKALGSGEFIFAAKEFFAAYEITKDPILFFKIGLSHDMAGDCGSASIFYRRYLNEANPTGDEKADAEKRLAACDAKLGPVSSGEPGPASTPVPTTIPVPELSDEPEPEPEATTPEVEEDSDLYRPSVGKASTLQTVAWTTIGAAAAAATAAAVLSISANARQDDLEDLLALPSDGVRVPFEGVTREQYEDFVDDGERLETMAYIAWGVAGAAATTAIILFIVDSGDDDTAEASATVVPSAGPNGSVGVSASWEF